MKTLLHLVYYLENCNMQMIGQFLCFPHGFPRFTFSDIQLLNSRVRDDKQKIKHQQDCNIMNDSVTNVSDVLGHSTCSRNTNNHTSSMSSFATATETDLERLKDKNKNKNTMKSTVAWVNRFET